MDLDALMVAVEGEGGPTFRLFWLGIPICHFIWQQEKNQIGASRGAHHNWAFSSSSRGTLT
jgi:hypothetical protein